MRVSETLSLTDAKFEPVLKFGMVEISHADKFPIGTANLQAKEHEASIALFYPEDGDAEGGLAVIYMYRQLKTAAEFQKKCEFFSDKRKTRVRMVEGDAFVPTQLSLPKVPEGCTHDAWANSKQEIIHTYQHKNWAVLLRMYGSEKVMLKHPLLTKVQKNLRIIPDQWETTLPNTVRRRGAKPRYKEKPLDADTRKDLDEAILLARKRLKTTAKTKPDKVQERIHEEINALRALKKKPSAEELKSIAIDLGALWGQTLCDSLGWEWASLKGGDHDDLTAVCSPTRSHLVNPIGNTHRILTGKLSTTPNNSLLLYNMIWIGRLPASAAQSYMELG